MDIFSRQEALSLQVLENCRNELCDLFPYLDGAFACLPYRSRRQSGWGTDGIRLYFFPPELLRQYSASPVLVRRGYLHVLLHCLYLHLFRPGDMAPAVWDLACDMAVEQLIEIQAQPRLVRSDPVRTNCFAVLGPKPLPAERIAVLLQQGGFPYSMEQLCAAFHFDDHSFWDHKPAAGVRSQWEQVQAYTGQSRQGSGDHQGTAAGSSEELLSPADRARCDYRRYLRRFMVPREELELDEDSFDYIYYNFGLTHYGSMPLIEPLEYKEVNRLGELVIAIDTSGSCSSETVRQFLAETYEILSQRENFFRKMKVYFIQCDCCIQDVALIHSPEEWDAYVRHIRIQGRGGTDFRPVFDYVQTLRAQHTLTELKALLYFTDGDGVYPTQPPDYETVFVLLKGTGRPDLTPKWAKKLLI